MIAAEWSAAQTAQHLRRATRTDHKYRRGVLGVRTGDASFPGAAVLGVSAAWATGIGLLRYLPPLSAPTSQATGLGLPSPAAAVLAAHPETVFGDGACDARLLGSGTDPRERAQAEADALRAYFTGSDPLIIDAGALDLVGRVPLTAPAILTPHAGEFARLWEQSATGQPPADPIVAASALADALDAAVLLKGSVTVAAAPGFPPLLWGPATPWLATAGTGDVLAGVLGALTATHWAAEHLSGGCGGCGGSPVQAAAQQRSLQQGIDARHTTPQHTAELRVLAELGATAAALHDTAARIAAHDPDGTGAGHPITAGDVVSALPAAWERLSLLTPQ